jgi:hypothetical protein
MKIELEEYSTERWNQGFFEKRKFVSSLVVLALFVL